MTTLSPGLRLNRFDIASNPEFTTQPCAREVFPLPLQSSESLCAVRQSLQEMRLRTGSLRTENNSGFTP